MRGPFLPFSFLWGIESFHDLSPVGPFSRLGLRFT